MTANDKVKKFVKELQLIEDKELNKFAKDIIKSADDRFFIEPASSSGKYHPEFARVIGGLLLHTKAVVFFLKEILRSEMYEIDKHHQELLIIAAIAHDIKKYGEEGKDTHTVNNHPELAAKYVEEVNKKSKILKKDELKYLQRAIITHMGIFGNEKPKTDDEKLLHLADMLASRKEIDLEFSKEEKKEALPNLDEYQIDFGKYKGKLIKEVPDDYLEWAVDNMEKNSKFKSLAKQILKERKNERIKK